MNNPAVVDIGPLSWVQGEINLALGKAADALQAYEHGLASEDEGQPALLSEARAQLHQAHGALTVVGLAGITRYSEVLEQLLSGLAAGQVAATSESLTLCRQALGVISAYLDSLLAGEPDQPLRLLASYRELMALLGVAEVSPAELYFPDLSQRPPKREQEPAPLSAEALAARLKAARLGFQRGLLKWFKGEARGLTEMRNTLNVIEATQRTPAARAFWWLSLGLMDALSAAGLEVDAPLRKLCGRIDAQIARLADGDVDLPERLSREVLYYIASAQADSEHLACIRAAYRLADHPTDLPAAAAAADAGLRHQPQLRALRTALEAAKEEWHRYANQTASALPQFHGHTATLASTAQALKQLDLARLTASVHAVASMLHNQPSLALDEGLALEVATALLLVDNAAENFSQLGVDFAHQVDVMTGRLTALLRGEPAASLAAMELPQLDDMSRQAQERLLMNQVVREIQGNLAQVEQKLDAYFRDPAARVQELGSVEAPLHQIGGALSMLGETRAVELLQDCRTRIQDFAQTPADEAAFAEVAQQLSALGFFVDKLRHGPADLEALLQNQHPAALTQEEREAVVPEPAALSGEVAPALMAVADVATAEEAGVVAANPADGVPPDAPPAEPPMGSDLLMLADELQQEAQAAAAIAAQLGDTRSLPPLPALASSELAATEETQRLVLASRETLDAELLGIFLEEAHEVLATIGTQLPQLVEQAGDRDMLASLRRAFHTLKGSGRMVGLDELGEAAWAVEQVMNRWLERDESATASLLVMLNAARRLFSGWVAGLEVGAEVPGSESGALIDLHAACARLLQDEVTRDDGEQPGTADAGDDSDSAEARSASQVESGLDDLAQLPAALQEEAGATRTEALDAGDAVIAESDADTVHAPTTPPTPPEVMQLGELSLSPAVFEVYLTEAHEHLAVLQAQQPQLLSAPPDKTMLRASHTLGGVSGTLGIMAINALGKALEHALERFAQADRALAAEDGARVGQVIDQLAQMLQQVAELRLPQAAPELVAALQAMTPRLEVMPHPGEPLAQTLDSMTSADTLAAEVPDMAAVPEPAVLAQGYDAAATQFTAPASLVEQRTHLRIRDDLDAQLLPFFLEEGVDLMLEVGVGLRSWRAAPADGAVAAHLQRLLHTLKGSARMAGAMQLGELVHGLETRIIQATRHGAAASGELLDECEACFDRAQGMFEELQQRASGELEVASDEFAAAPLAPPLAASLAQEPGLPQATHELATPQEGAAPRAQLRVRAELVDQFINEVGEMAIARNRVEAEMRTAKAALLDLTENVIRLRQQLREIEIQAESQLQSQLSQLQEQHQDFDPLEMDRYTRFQELTRMMAESVNDVTTVQHNLLHNLDSANAALTAQARQSRELSQALMSVRMVPFNASIDRLYRVVRQTAKELDKRANLELRGGQVELDRSVLEKMLGPIEHLLRNCIAHGIETPAERAALGKAPIGEIQLALSQQGNEIVIDMSDDGAGLNHERIRARAEEQGLLAPGQPIDERQLAQLIFAPGFSTAREVTAVAGRGVGMDVVKAETISLGGRIELQSTPGQGTRFRIFLPLTLAITQALLVRCGNRVYALPSSMVAQAREQKPEALAEIRRQGGDDWLEQHYPWSYLPQLLGERHAQPVPARRHWLLYLKGADQHLALEVDGLVGNQEIVVKPIGTQLARLPGVIGATVLNDGAIALILNPLALMQHEQEELLATTLTSTSLAAAATQVPLIMVVDDSLTVRKIATRLLTREGYQVATAKDGVDALEQLLEVVPAAMLVDIEMPRMDGFELTRHVRNDARLKDVPIVMITSRIAEKHRAYARELGVNAYLGKPYDEQELLELLRGFASR